MTAAEDRTTLPGPAAPAASADDRDDLLARWLTVVEDAESVLSVVDRGRPVAASPSQRGLWLAQEIEGDASTAMATRHVYRLRGALDVPALSSALDHLVERHESLRTSFRIEGAELLQHIEPSYRLGVVAEPLAANPAVPGADLHAAVAAAMRDPLDLAAGRVVRARLFRVADTDHILVLVIHHIAVDGGSMSVLHRDLAELYAAACENRPAELEPMRFQYLDFAEWQRREVADGSYNEGVEYWRTALDGVQQLLPLPTDRPRPATQSFRGEWKLFPIPRDVAARVGEVARSVAATPHIVTLTAFVAMLAQWTRHSDFVVGTAVNHRPLPETEDMVGPFASILPVRYSVDLDSTFRSCLAQVKEQMLAARTHENVPLELILSGLGAVHSPAHNPLVQVTMSYKTGVIDDPILGGDVAMTAEPLELADVEVQRDLTVEIMGTKGDQLVVAYASDLWDRSTIEALAAAYLVALEHCTAHLDDVLRDVNLPLPATAARNDATAEPALEAAASAALPAPVSSDPPEQDAIEYLVRQAWQEILDVPEIGPASDFFELGGESLGAMRVCNRISTTLGGRIPLRSLYENPEMAEFVADVRSRTGDFEAVAR